MSPQSDQVSDLLPEQIYKYLYKLMLFEKKYIQHWNMYVSYTLSFVISFFFNFEDMFFFSHELDLMYLLYLICSFLDFFISFLDVYFDIFDSTLI